MLADAGALLQRDGYFVIPRLFHSFPEPQCTPAIAAAADEAKQHVASHGPAAFAEIAAEIDRLERAGWPPVFCFMCDSVWHLVVEQLWEAMKPLLGDDCVLEPSFFAWSLKAPKEPPLAAGGDASSRKTDHIGQSFGLPHRDYPASEAWFLEESHAGSEDAKEGTNNADNDNGTTATATTTLLTTTPAPHTMTTTVLKLLNVWIPINDATLDNGCIHILPREFDPCFARPDDHAHMRAATGAPGGKSVCKIRFPLQCSRALPAPAGSLLAWSGNTIHWGSTCSRYAASPPRKSIAMAFRRRDVAQLEGAGPPITQERARAMTMDGRLALIARSLLLYNQWHTLKASVVPAVLFDVTTRGRA